MKNKLVSFCVLLIYYGCKVNQEKSERLHTDSRSQSSLEANTAWMQFKSQDSSYRYWYYTSDSSFYFHPDEGLWGQSGRVLYREQKRSEINDINYRMAYDSLGISHSKQESDQRSSWTRYSLTHGVWLLLIPLILLAAYFYRKR